MRIAQVAPLFESVPPRLYGGTERIVSYLTEELVRLGHEVTLFAAGDSQTSAELVAPCARAIRLDPGCVDELSHHVMLLELVRRRAADFDLLHFHTELVHLPLARALHWPHLTTTHNQLDVPGLVDVWREVADSPLVSISNAQRAQLPSGNWIGTVYHGLPDEAFEGPVGQGGDYLLFVGRISPEKRPDRAVEIARRAGMRLVVAAKISAKDQAYADSLAPLLREPFVEYLGEVTAEERTALMAGARALVFPIDWPEPFGLVMIEAMSCGTPVVAWPCGSVPEVVDDGVTGFVVDDLDAAASAVHDSGDLDRGCVRDRAQERFSAARMTADYLRLYAQLAAHPPHHGLRGRQAVATAP